MTYVFVSVSTYVREFFYGHYFTVGPCPQKIHGHRLCPQYKCGLTRRRDIRTLAQFLALLFCQIVIIYASSFKL